MAAAPVPSLRPLGIGDLLDELFAVYRRRFRTFVGISAVVQVPIALLSLPQATTSPGYYLYALLNGQFGSLLNAPRESSGVASALFVVVMVLALVGTVLELAATSEATAAYYRGDPPSIERPYRQALSHFWPLARLFTIMVLTFFGLMLLAIMPLIIPPLACLSFPGATVLGIYLFVSWSLAPVALILENQRGALLALGRGRSLVRGAWWRTFLTLVCLGALIAVLQLSASTLSELVAFGLQAIGAPGATQQPTWIAAVASLLNNLVALVIGPLYYIGICLLYYDRRVRAEGYDLAVQARALRQAATATEAV